MKVSVRCMLGFVAVVAGLGSTAPGAWAAPPSFADHVDYAVGDLPAAQAAVGDFNEDGSPDVIATRSEIDKPLALLLGNGKGVLGSAKAVSDSGFYPSALKAVDVSKDGHLDLLTTTGGDGGVALGDGKGGFGTRSVLDTGGSAKDIEVGDLDKDNDADLVVVGNGVRTFLGDGKGGFIPKFTSAGSAFRVELADMNGDKVLDAVVSTGDNKVSVQLGDGAGGFGTPKAYAVDKMSYSSTVGDFTGDGKLDVVAENFNEESVSLFPGDGAGGLGTKQQIATGPYLYDLQTADVNYDGKSDVVAKGSRAVIVLQGTGSTLGNRIDFGSASGSQTPALGDLDKDGKLDLVTPNYDSQSVSVLLNTTDLVPPVTSITSGPSSVTNNPNPSFGFTSSEAGSKFTCTFSESGDGNSSTETKECTSGKTYGPLGEGSTYTFEVRATDKAGNPGNTVGRTFTVDLTAPQKPTITSPTVGAILTSATFAVVGTAEANSTVEVFDGSASLGTAQASNDGTWSKSLSGVANGSHSYTAKASDAATNVSAPSTAVPVTVNAPSNTDGGGGAGSTGSGSGSAGVEPSGQPKDVIAPALSQPKLSAIKFAVDTKAKASTAAKKIRKGTTLSFRLSEAAKVSIATQQKVRGKWRTLSTFTKSLKSGTQKVKYSGRIKVRGRSKSLKPGRYRLGVRATDSSGNKGKVRTITFTIVKGG